MPGGRELGEGALQPQSALSAGVCHPWPVVLPQVPAGAPSLTWAHGGRGWGVMGGRGGCDCGLGISFPLFSGLSTFA